MKRLQLFFFFVLALAISMPQSNAQQAKKLVKKEGLKEGAFMVPFHTLMTPDLPGVPAPAGNQDFPVQERTELETVIGTTVYDLQTNYSACNRISEDSEGNIYAVWTQGYEDGDGYGDRGTGYNRYDAASGTWNPIPTERLEESVRTGWPNHVITDSGTEFSVAHVFTDGEYRMHYLRKEAGETEWTEGDVPSNTPVGVLWPRAASSGENIHVIGVTTPTGDLGGEIYEGVDLHPLYYRSTDGGASWDIVDGIIPGLDSTFMLGLVSADSYSIDARGDVVTVGVFSQWNDVKIYKSTDNGDTWTSFRVFDFPIDKYVLDAGYTTDDLPMDPDAPDSLSIQTTDNAGFVMIDNDDNVHTFFGNMYVQDADLTDGGWTYFPGTSGLHYWNESYGEDSTNIIADVLDLNGNDTLDVDGIGVIPTYFMSLTSMPTAGVDEDNNIYVAYSMLMEGEDYIDDDDEQHFRHIGVIKSEDGGETWSEVYDAINEVTIGDIIFTFEIEAVFPTMVRDVTGGEIKMIYQQDFQPGLALRGDMDDAGENNINFLRINTLLSSEQEVVEPETFQFELMPNPTGNSTTIAYDLAQNAKVELSLFNSVGQQVRQITSADLQAGPQQAFVDVNNLSNGMYLVRLQIGEQVSMKKLVVKK
jgi:hypothetical protein